MSNVEPAITGECLASEDLVKEVGQVEEVELSAPKEPDWIVLDSGEASLDEAEASIIAADIGATIILVAGTQEAGKTTLLVELYAQFLSGPCADLRFAGSKTLDAFDHRQFASRLGSGNKVADTLRTEESDMRLLHLRLANLAGDHLTLMLSDLKGELFEDLINGVDAVDNLVPLAHRADKVILLIDGKQVVDQATRQSATFRARLLVGALAETGGIGLHAPVLIVLSKADLLDDAALAWYDNESLRLVDHARQLGLQDVGRLNLAARPMDNSNARGLSEILHWMWVPASRPPVSIPSMTARSTRVFLTGEFA